MKDLYKRRRDELLERQTQNGLVKPATAAASS